MSTSRAITPSIQTLYQDLIQSVHFPDLQPGSVYKRDVRGISYAYVKQPVGRIRRDRFLGRADAPEVHKQIADIQAASLRAKARREIVRALKSAGLPGPIPALAAVLDAMADAGLTRQMVLVGTAAFQCYPAIVGAFLPSPTMMTQDADFATESLAIAGNDPEESMQTILQRADPTFSAIPGLDRKALPSSFRSATGFVVDLLTPQLRRDDKNPMPIKGLEAGATPLQHLRWAIQEPIAAVVLSGSGIAVRLPSPARFAIHKLIVAQKRSTDRAKRSKDLMQAEALIDILKDSDPWALSDAYQSACEKGLRGWREPIDRSLQEIGRSSEWTAA